RLGTTAYKLAAITLAVEGSPFAPASVLNTVRREAIELLQARQTETLPHEIRDPEEQLGTVLASRPEAAQEPAEPQLHLLVRTPDQLEAALSLGPASITLDYLDLYG